MSRSAVLNSASSRPAARSLRGLTFPTLSEASYDQEMAWRRESDAHEAFMAAEAVRALTDPSLQCHHGVSVHLDCDPCCDEVGDPRA